MTWCEYLLYVWHSIKRYTHIFRSLIPSLRSPAPGNPTLKFLCKYSKCISHMLTVSYSVTQYHFYLFFFFPVSLLFSFARIVGTQHQAVRLDIATPARSHSVFWVPYCFFGGSRITRHLYLSVDTRVASAKHSHSLWVPLPLQALQQPLMRGATPSRNHLIHLTVLLLPWELPSHVRCVTTYAKAPKLPVFSAETDRTPQTC